MKATCKEIPAFLRTGYKGRKLHVEARADFAIPSDAGLWSGGSREKYTLVRLSDGVEASDPLQHASPWNAARTERRFQMVPGFAVKVHSMFCGTDCGLTFYVHPDDMARLLPAPRPGGA